jgi:hypothetical protein
MTLSQSIRRALTSECKTDFARIFNFSPLPAGQGGLAHKLGVTREHLNRVLRGHRQSRSLLRRYDELMKQAA